MAWFTRDVTRTLMAQGPVVAFGLIASVLTARVLGPEARGEYALCFMIVNTTVFFAQLHLGQSVVYHIGRHRLSASPALGATLALVVVIGGLVLAGLHAASPWLLKEFSGLTLEPLSVIALAAPLMLANSVLTDFFRGIDRLDLFNACRLLTPVLRVIGLASAFLLGGDLLEALYAILIVEIVILPVQLILLLRLVKPRFERLASISTSFLDFGARMVGASAIGQVDHRVSGFIVAYYLASDQLAFFNIAEGLVSNLMALPTLVGDVLLPKIARQGEAEAARMTAATCRSTLFVTALVSLVIAVLSHLIVIGLYGAEYQPAALVVVALLPVAVGRAGVRILSRYVMVINRLRVLVYANAITLTVHVLLLLVLVPSGGIVGAAIATSITYALRFVIVCGAFRSLSGLGLRETLIVDREDLARLVRAGLDAVTLRALRASDGGSG